MTFVDARLPKKQISLRLDPEVIIQLKTIAARKGIGYQTLIRMWVMERLSQESS
jgi:predicted DNA binding CopG/RHH family protein